MAKLPASADLPDKSTDPDAWARTWGAAGQTVEVDPGDSVPQLWAGATWDHHEKLVELHGEGTSATVLRFVDDEIDM